MKVFQVPEGVAVILTAKEAADFHDAPGYPRPVHDVAEYAVRVVLGEAPEMAPAFAEKVRAVITEPRVRPEDLRERLLRLIGLAEDGVVARSCLLDEAEAIVAEVTAVQAGQVVVDREDLETLVSGFEHGYDNRYPSQPEFQAAIRLREALGGESPLAYMKKE